MNNTSISVIIPTFNRAQLVGKAIASAINQTYKHTEIIVVDDGSSDGTQDVVASFGDSVKYVFKPNEGVASARNLGIKISTGDLVAFLDSDDEWLPEKLEKQLAYLNNHPDYGMVLCDYYFKDSNHKITGKSDRRKNIRQDGDILADVLLATSLVPPTVLVKRKVLEDVGCFDENLKTAEDLDLHLRIAEKYKIGLLCEPLVSCMRGNNGLSELSCTYDDHVKVIERFVWLHDERFSERQTRNGRFNAYLVAADGKFYLLEFRAGSRLTIKALSQIASIRDLFEIIMTCAKGLKCFTKNVIRICLSCQVSFL